MADYLEFPGRTIEDVPFTGLLESLTIIGLTAAVGIEAEAHLSKEDLVGILKQIQTEQAKAIAFSGASADEAKQLNRHLMKHMSTNF